MRYKKRTISIDDKIEKAKKSAKCLKAKYDAAVDELEKEEIMAAIMDSGKSYDEILKFLKNDI